MPRISLPNNWAPRPYQLNLWRYLEQGGKRACAIWHRRAGKDELALHWAACAAMQRPGNYWHMLPQYSQARKAIWEAVNPHTGRRRIDEAFPKEIRATTREQEMMIRFRNGATWQVVGSDSYDNLVGSPPIGVVFSEWALAKPSAWAFLRPILAENGGWSLFITTPRGSNHARITFEAAQTDPAWYAERLPATETGVFSAALLESERREYVREYGADEGEALFAQEYMCAWDAPVQGAYYAAEIRQARADERVRQIPVLPNVPVNTFWDLGYNDETAIWFHQRASSEDRFIDYLEARNKPLSFYAQQLQAKGYLYGTHYLPHDADNKSLQTGKSVRNLIEEMLPGARIEVVPRVENLVSGINQTRAAISSAWFDAERCANGLSCLENYRREYDERLRAYKATPLHDWASNGADAFRQFAQAMANGGIGAGKAKPFRRSGSPMSV